MDRKTFLLRMIILLLAAWIDPARLGAEEDPVLTTPLMDGEGDGVVHVHGVAGPVRSRGSGMY